MISSIKRLLKTKEESEPTKISWTGFYKEGAVNYTQSTAIGELINNILTLCKKGALSYRFQLVIDTITREMWITDNFIGIPKQNMNGLHDLGTSYKTPAILSEHGGGVKSAMAWLCNWFKGGRIVKYISSIDGNDFWKKLPNYANQLSQWFKPQKARNIKIYDTSDRKWKDQLSTGTQLVGIMGEDRCPKSGVWFENLKDKLGAKYFEYLGKTLEVELVWLKDGEFQASYGVNAIEPLKSHKVVEGKPAIDKKKKIGQNEWELDEVFTCPDTLIQVHVKAGWAPHWKNVEEHYKTSKRKDERYNPEVYKTNPYRYAGPNVGLHYCKQWVPIDGGKFKATSRAEAMIGFINIISGIDTVKTKNGIQSSEDLPIFEKNLLNYLKKKGFRVRSRDTYFKTSESEMEETLLKKLKTSKKLRKYLDVDNGEEFDNQWSSHSGTPDIVGLLKSKPVFITEVKKEGGKDLWKACFQGVTYAMEQDLKSLLIVAQDSELQSDIEIKLDIWKQKGWTIRYEQYQHLIGSF